MSARVNVKPLMHWLIYRGYTVRITQRAQDRVEGVLTTANGPVPLAYDPVGMVVTLPDATVAINEYGWEIEPGTNQQAT
jgi:hypothetical protein